MVSTGDDDDDDDWAIGVLKCSNFHSLVEMYAKEKYFSSVSKACSIENYELFLLPFFFFLNVLHFALNHLKNVFFLRS